MTGDANLLPDAMSEADLPDIPVFVLNDAELAAASARVTHDIETVTLVLTIGFGVGGAWITP
jgi:predicted NBD/HSP70 family sugar kinase